MQFLERLKLIYYIWMPYGISRPYISYLIVIIFVLVFGHHGDDYVCEDDAPLIALLVGPVLHLIDAVQRPIHVAADLRQVSVIEYCFFFIFSCCCIV